MGTVSDLALLMGLECLTNRSVRKICSTAQRQEADDRWRAGPVGTRD